MNSIVQFMQDNSFAPEDILTELDAYLDSDTIEDFIETYIKNYDLDVNEED